MKKSETPEKLASEFTKNISSNTELLKLMLASDNEDVIVEGGNCEICCCPSSIKFKFILCDVNIHVKDSPCVNALCKSEALKNQEPELKESSEKISKDSSKSNNIATSNEEKSIKTQSVENVLVEKENFQSNEKEQIQAEKAQSSQNFQDKIQQLEEIKKSLMEGQKDKEVIEVLKAKLNVTNKKITELEEALKKEAENKIALQAIINERKNILDTVSLGSKRFLESYKNELEYLKNNLTIINKQISKLEESLKQEYARKNLLKEEISEKYKNLFKILSFMEE